MDRPAVLQCDPSPSLPWLIQFLVCIIWRVAKGIWDIEPEKEYVRILGGGEFFIISKGYQLREGLYLILELQGPEDRN